MSDLVFEVEVEVPEVDVSVVEPVVAALVVAGPQGPPGVTGYVHTQSTPAATWTVSHTLGRVPLSSELTIAGEVVHSDITFPDASTAVVTFASPQAGVLRLT